MTNAERYDIYEETPPPPVEYFDIPKGIEPLEAAIVAGLPEWAMYITIDAYGNLKAYAEDPQAYRSYHGLVEIRGKYIKEASSYIPPGFNDSPNGFVFTRQQLQEGDVEYPDRSQPERGRGGYEVGPDRATLFLAGTIFLIYIIWTIAKG